MVVSRPYNGKLNVPHLAEQRRYSHIGFEDLVIRYFENKTGQ